jgi:hypothetical protein
MAGALLLLFTFPSGQFVPRWTRLLALVWVGLNLLWLVAPQTPFNPLNGPVWRATPAASFAVGMAWFASGLAAQGYRYRRVSGLVERQQTKWTLLGLAAAVAGGVLYYGLLALGPGRPLVGRSGFSELHRWHGRRCKHCSWPACPSAWSSPSCATTSSTSI